MSRYVSLIAGFILFCTPLYAQPSAAAQPGPDTVSMPWKTFTTLRESAKTPEARRKLAYSYEKALYTGKARIDKEDYFIHFQADITVDTFKKRDVLVPFLSGKLNLESVLVDGRQATWIEQQGFFQTHIATPGRHTIGATFTIVTKSKKWPRSFFLPLVKIARSRVQLSVPDTNVKAEFDNGVAMESVSGGTGDRISGYVPAVSGVNIRWLKKNAEKKKIPLKMGATVGTYLSLEEKGAYCQNEVTFRILQGETNFFTILVPGSVDILEVSPGNKESAISQWFTEETGADRMIHVYSSYQQKKEFKVKIVYEHTETKASYGFTIPRLVPRMVERYDTLIAVGSKANVEISENRAARVERRDVRFLAQGIRQFAQSNALFYYKTLDGAFDLEFTVKSHEKARTVTTRIESVEADSVLTEAGTLMTKATYNIKNNQAQFLQVTLPAKSRLLSAFLRGAEVQPALDGKALLIPIAKSADTAFPVEIAYLTEIDSFRMLGRRTIRLPEISQPVGELYWRLYAPEAYQIIRFWGNMERKTFGPASRLSWLLSRADGCGPPAAYAGGGGQSYDYSKKSLRKRFKSSFDADEYAQEITLNNQIQVQIPVTGLRYRFEAYLVKGFTPEISFFFIDNSLKNGIAMVAGVVVFCFVFWTLALGLERGSLPDTLQKTTHYLTGLCPVVLLGIAMVLFSFSITAVVGKAVAFSLVGFSVWQHRRVSGRFRLAGTAGWKRRLLNVLFAVYLFVVFVSLVGGLFGTAGFLAVVSVLFHRLMPVWGKVLNALTKAGAKGAVSVLWILPVAALVAGSLAFTPAWAETPVPAKVPDLSGARVNMAWQRIEAMLKKIEEKKKIEKTKLAFEYLFGDARITGNVSKKYADLKIKIPLSILSDHYIKIPLLPAAVPVSRAEYNGKAISLSEEKGNVVFEAKKESDAIGLLEMDLVVPVREKGGVHEFSINTPLLRGGVVALTFGKEIKSVLLHGVSWQKREGQKIAAALGRSQHLKGELATFERKKETADESKKRVKKIYSTTYTLVSLEEEVAAFYSSVRYRILNDQVTTFEIGLPETVVVHEIVGDDLESWEKRETRDGMTAYRVKVLYPVTGKYDLSVQYETSLKNTNGRFTIPGLQVMGVARDVGFFGIEMQAQAEIFLETIQRARLIDIRELPQIIRADAYSPMVYAIRYVERPYTVTFEIRKHKNFQMDPAIADRIQHTLVISPQGKLLSQVRMWIRNSRKQFAVFHLPPGSRLVSTFLDDVSVKPSLGNDGELLLPLKRQSTNPFVLDVVYEGREVPLHLLGGHVDLTFPWMDIPASMVTSEIYTPRQVYFSRPTGDFRQAGVSGFVSWRKNLLLTEDRGAPAKEAEDFKSRGDEPVQGGFFAQQQQPQMALPLQVPPAPNQQVQPMDNINRIGGTLSLKITLPKRGKKLAFNTFYVPEKQALKIRFFTCRRIVYYIGYGLSVVLFLAAGVFIPLVRRLPGPAIVLCAAGAWILFYPMPFSWQYIFVFMAVGVGLYSGGIWILRRMK